MSTIGRMQNNEIQIIEKKVIIYYKIIMINILNLENSVAQVLGPICNNNKNVMMTKLLVMTSHMSFMIGILVTNSTIYSKISINVSQINNMKLLLL
jgi:hypothetical protein